MLDKLGSQARRILSIMVGLRLDRGPKGLDSAIDPETQRQLEVLDRWLTFDGCALGVIKAATEPTSSIPVTDAQERFAKMDGLLRSVLGAAAQLARKGKKSDNECERESAFWIHEQLQELFLAVLGDWFLDWIRANTVFFVNFRELLAKHPGEYALLVPDRYDEEWEIAGVSSDPCALAEKGKALGFPPSRMFVRHIVEGADCIETLDLSRPESIDNDEETESR